MSATIQAMGKECRELADKGARWNSAELGLFEEELRFWHLTSNPANLAQCEALIRTLKERKTK